MVALKNKRGTEMPRSCRLGSLPLLRHMDDRQSPRRTRNINGRRASSREIGPQLLELRNAAHFTTPTEALQV